MSGVPVSPARLWALSRKEAVQIVRDPSSILIAFVLPIIMLFLFGYAINLDTGSARIALVIEDSGASAWRVAQAIDGSPNLDITMRGDRGAMGQALRAGRVRGLVIIPSDFSDRANRPGGHPVIQVVTDGSEPNTAAFVGNYVVGAVQNAGLIDARRLNMAPSGIVVDQRYWFNPSTVSRNALVPGSIVIVMTVIGALLTALVVAREWERGTMEALLSTPVTRIELLLSKLLPYFVLGMVSMCLCVLIATWVMGVPFRGSVALLLLATSAFLGTALGLGLLLSTLLRNQFNAAQAALNAAFLPAMMLSGFVFEISSMPRIIQWIASAMPARYFVTILQTLFQTDHAGWLFWSNYGVMTLIACIYLGLTTLRTRRTLD